MSYIDKTFYNSYFGTDTEISDTDFNRLAEISSNLVNRLTYDKIDRLILSNFSADLQTKIKNCVAEQVKMLDEHGGVNALFGDTALTNSAESIGNYSFSKSNNSKVRGSNVRQIDGIPISPLINVFLANTGLLSSAINKSYSVGDFE